MDKYLKPSDNTGEMVTTCKVVFQPSGAAGMVECGTSLLEAARQLGVGIESICGGAGTCGKCQVVIEEGQFPKHNMVSSPLHASPASDTEMALCGKLGLAPGVRLSCMALLEGDLLVTVPEEARANKQIVVKAATDRIIQVDPAVRMVYLTITPPTCEDRSDQERVLALLAERFDLSEVEFDLPALRALPGA